MTRASRISAFKSLSLTRSSAPWSASREARSSTVAPAVYYIPRKDVKMDRLVRTTHRTYCPFKGYAAYYSLRDGAENAVWTYEKPYDEMSVLRELLAFYPEKVDSIKTM